MKNFLPILVVGILVLSGLGASALIIEKESNSSERATHTPLGEFGTATWCGYCRYAHGALKELYAEGQLDFYYITYVCDKNTKAASYCSSHYNLYGYPTLWWDGGYRVNVGAGSVPSAKSAYTSSINSCSNRAVKDIEIDLSVSWLGGTEMEIACTVTNNEGSSYDGWIHVAICEEESSRGWIDSGGVTYTMTFLDWAFNEELSISGGGYWSDTMTWDGSSHGYPTVSKENIIVIAAAYNDEWHQGYSYPPNSNPFDAYYIDECVGVNPNGGSTNNAPGAPTIEGPTSGSIGTEYTWTLNSVDPDGDDVFYYILWGDGYKEIWKGPHASGADASFSHTYDRKGTFEIEAKSRDTKNAESDWTTLTVTMPRNKVINSPFLQFLQQFSTAFPILRQLLGL